MEVATCQLCWFVTITFIYKFTALKIQNVNLQHFPNTFYKTARFMNQLYSHLEDGKCNSLDPGGFRPLVTLWSCL